MFKFHNTVSRRDFMKFMGIAAAGAGGAALVAPVFHDLDELSSSSLATQKRPWYVKERDFYNPTVEVDWTLLTRRNPTHTGQEVPTNTIYYGARATSAASVGAAYTA